jgi:hypothetical protein
MRTFNLPSIYRAIVLGRLKDIVTIYDTGAHGFLDGK